jgi:hypothetical protein
MNEKLKETERLTERAEMEGLDTSPTKIEEEIEENTEQA